MSNDAQTQKNFSQNQSTINMNVIQPVKVQAQLIETDWEMWKKLGDPEKQVDLLTEWNRLTQKLGLLRNEFIQWADNYFASKRYSDLTADEKAFLMWKFLDDNGLINTFLLILQDAPEIYFTWGNNDILYLLETGKNHSTKWSSFIVTSFFGETSSKAVNSFVKIAMTKSKSIDYRRINPVNKLRLQDGVLDLETLSFSRTEESDRYYFTYYAPLFLNSSTSLSGSLLRRLEDIKAERYDITQNRIYQLFRKHFDDANWRYFISAVGTILSPYRHKLIAFIVGPTGAGKSTLLKILMKPVQNIVAHVQLRDLLDYKFARESLIGKQILVSYERGEVVLRNIDLLNTLFGESDEILVHRKYKSAVKITSLKAGFIAMNDLPLVNEYGGETMYAFAERLSIINMTKPEGFEPIIGLSEKVKPEEAFEFLAWARIQLEKRGWKIERMETNEVIDLMRTSNNSAYQFLTMSDDIIEDPNDKIKGSELYELYTAWCDRKGIKPLSRNDFYMIVSRYYQKIPPEKSPDKSIWFRGLRKASRSQQDTTRYELTRFSE
jgi:energy-coupling factor transporter ATP-binding protein EcfA2